MRSILVDSTNQSTEVRILRSNGLPWTDVAHDAPGLSISYLRNGGSVVPISLAALAAISDPHSDGGFIHEGTGIYRIDPPDAAFVDGSVEVLIFGEITGGIIIPAKHPLVQFDVNNPVDLASAQVTGILPIANGGTNADTAAEAASNLGLGTEDAPQFAGIDVRGISIFNENGDDVDFRIEGDTDANLFIADAGLDSISIGEAAPTRTKFNVRYNPTFTTSGNTVALKAFMDVDPGAASAASIRAFNGQVTTLGAFNFTGSINSFVCSTIHGGSATVTNAFGFQLACRISSTGTITNATGISTRCAIDATASSATMTNAFAMTAVVDNLSASSTLTRGIGIFVDAPGTTGTITGYAGVAINAASGPTNSSLLLIGTATVPSGTYAIHSSSTLNSYLNGNLNIGTTTYPASATKALTLANGTAPSGSVTDACVMYSADQAAGNAAPHFRTELGDVIKLYKQAHVADPSGGGTQDAEARTAINSILLALENVGLLAAS